MNHPELKVPTKIEEESKITYNLLKRLEEALGTGHPGLFPKALEYAGVSKQDYDLEKPVNLTQLNRVQQFTREHFPEISLRMYSVAELLDLGLMGYAIVSSGTIKKALDIALRYHELTADRYQLYFEIDGAEAVIRPVPLMRFLPESRDIADECISGIWTILKQLMNPQTDFQKAHVCLAFPAEPYEQAYLDVFECRLTFENLVSEIRFPVSWLQAKVTTANMNTSSICVALCERIMGRGESSSGTVERVQRLLLSNPGRNVLRLEEAAEELLMSVSQLRKRLYRSGTSYKQVVLDLRMALAKHYLEATTLPIKEVAYLLDYADPAPFCRAFKKHIGISPKQFREQ